MSNPPQARPRRCWINQPSTLQPLHKYHGTLVLAVPYAETSSDCYLLSGDVVSMIAPNLSLSEGWPESLRGPVPLLAQLREQECLFIEQHQFDKLREVEKVLYDIKPLDPDRRRDLANLLNLILGQVEDQNR